MAYTFLQAVNASLKKLGLISGSAQALTTFTDSSRQTAIDNVITAWNETIEDLSRSTSFKGEVSTSTFTLVTGTREYTLATDFNYMVGNPTCAAKRWMIVPYPVAPGVDAWLKMREDQVQPTDFTGQPSYWAISPNNGKIRVDRDPTSTENGDVYTYAYSVRINLSATTDAFPFSDTVVDNMQSAVVERYNMNQRNKFNQVAYSDSISRAAASANLKLTRGGQGYMPRRRSSQGDYWPYST